MLECRYTVDRGFPPKMNTYNFLMPTHEQQKAEKATCHSSSTHLSARFIIDYQSAHLANRILEGGPIDEGWGAIISGG